MKSRVKQTDEAKVPALDLEQLDVELDWPTADESLVEALAAGFEKGVALDPGTRRRLATLRRPRSASFSGPADPKRHPQD